VVCKWSEKVRNRLYIVDSGGDFHPADLFEASDLIALDYKFFAGPTAMWWGKKMQTIPNLFGLLGPVKYLAFILDIRAE
jgi:hypothetical protein